MRQTLVRSTNPGQYWERQLRKVRCPDLEILPVHTDVAHVRVFSRLFARRFRWGFAASKEEVQAASKDDFQLLAMMPEARPLVVSGKKNHLASAAWAAKSGNGRMAASLTAHTMFLPCNIQ